MRHGNVISRRATRALVVSAATVFLAGCGGIYDASVSGSVTLDGKALSRGTVKYNPEQTGPSGYGLINPDGTYEVMTGREVGLNPGVYVVTVVVNEPSTPNPDPSRPPTPGKPITPLWYRNQAQSPLKFTVEPGSNDIDLELTTQPPAGWNTGRQR